MKKLALCLTAAAMLALPFTPQLNASEAVTEEEGKHFDANDNPTYKVDEDGTVDWFTYSGFRRYHSECHVCHGPDGMGSTFAPAIIESLKDITYETFVDVVVNGQENVGVSAQSKMPAFGTNLNVMCFLDDIYIYLRARSDDAIGRGRPAKKHRKTEATRENEISCMEG